ncbi:uncharacterized protein LOC143281550 isoform X2 [Babylonia areolata]|uniref:uncharacterized protein LOC143281550 isoform X2 n=1 Tax=Babylonia areolata TaxID=304850 RepID=UPI003FD3D0E1
MTFRKRARKPWSVAMATADDLEQKLTCSICLQLFREPRLLPCGHTYCQHCLAGYILSRPPVPSPRGGQSGFSCPVCREFVSAPDRLTAPQHWAGKFKPNFLIRDIVEAHGKSKQRVQRPACPRHPNKGLELYCRDCRTTACDRCVALSHRRCEEVVELAEMSRESQQSARRHQQTVTRLLKQLEAKKRRCITGRRELERIERDMDAKIEREGQELLRKVADFLRSRKESLKRQAHAHCRQCVGVVNAYTEKCEELSGALRAVDRLLTNKLRPDRSQNKLANEQEEEKLKVMVQKLESAVQQLDAPCHFTVRLIMDDSALTAILANLQLGEIRTGEHGVGGGGGGGPGGPATPGSYTPSPSSSSSPASPAPSSVGYPSRCSSPERPSSASRCASCSPPPFSFNASNVSLASSQSLASSVSNATPPPEYGFNPLRARVVSDTHLSGQEGEGPRPGARAGAVGGDQALQPAPQDPSQRRQSVSRSPFDFVEHPGAPRRRKLSQP